MKIRPVRLTIADLLTRNVRQPKFEKSQGYNTLHFIESEFYNTLHFIRKIIIVILTHYLVSKAEGQINQSRLFYAFVNVHYVNVKPSIFDLWPFKHT